MSRPEGNFKDRLVDRMKARGCWVKKIHGEASQAAGVDLYALRRGIPAAIELKAGKCLDSVRLVAMATDLQLRDLLDFCLAGGGGWIVGEVTGCGGLKAVDMRQFSPKITTVSGVRQASKAGGLETLSFGSFDAMLDHIFRVPVC